ncbi:MAG: DUF2332 domain-containing protein [Motilibacteraceae bacterium]
MTEGSGTEEPPRERMARRMRQQGEACAHLGSPLYALLLDRAAEDVLAGGPTADVLAGHEDDPGPSALALRLLGSVHRLVLERKAPRLALHYPSVGGTAGSDGVWEAFREVLLHQGDEVRAGLSHAPQTNEVGRSAALVGGLRILLAERDLPVRLFEIGSSAGLNLRADRFRFLADDGFSYVPSDSPLVLAGAWTGEPLPAAPPLRIVERRGSDVAPLDASTTEGRLLLTSYVWPDQVARFERLRAALDVAAQVPATVRTATAAEAVAELVPEPGTWTVLWHSVMWQYLGKPEQAAVEDLLEQAGRRATDDAPLAHLELEPRRPAPGEEHRFLVSLRTWPGGGRRVLGEAAPHGLPVRWYPRG